MAETNRCPQCGAELAADAPQGVCPKCLLKLGLGSRPDFPSGPQPAETTPRPARFVPPPPEQLAAHFPQLEILELVGSGGMGAVYKARQLGLDRLVALKILPPEAGRDPAFAERFTREARAMARLSHPHIVAVHDFGQAPSPAAEEREGGEGGLYYFVMEYVDGVNLRETIQGGKLQPQEALAIVPQICEALQFAHDEGIVHRDIKPENILIDKRGRVKIADFGLAKLLGRAPADFTLTATGQVMGTPHYMAPEQMEHPLEVDHRADIYSLGVVFYEMLTGELPLGRFAPPSKKVQVDVRLDEVVLKTLEKEPQRRYQHVSDVKTDVQTIASSVSDEKAFPRWSAPAVVRVALAGSIVLGAAASIAFSPDISATMWTGLMLLTFLGFLVDFLRRPRQRRGLNAAFCLAAGLLAVFSYLLAVPQPVLKWVYAATGGTPGHDDPAFARVLIALLIVWLIAQMVHVRKKLAAQQATELKTDVESISMGAGAASPEALQAAKWRQAQTKPLPPGVGPWLLLLAIGIVLGMVTIAAGVVLAVVAVLTQQPGSGAFWGFMGGAFGCIFGGAGALLGTWNTYRQLEGAGDLMRSPDWTWLDRLIVGYTLLGILGMAAGLMSRPWVTWGTSYSLSLIGGIVIFQGLLFLVIRGLMRRAARQETEGYALDRQDVGDVNADAGLKPTKEESPSKSADTPAEAIVQKERTRAAEAALFSGALVLVHVALWVGLLGFFAAIVPGYEKTFTDFGVELPAVTSLLIHCSHYVVSYWSFMLLPGLGAAVIDYMVLLVLWREPRAVILKWVWFGLGAILPVVVCVVSWTLLAVSLQRLVTQLN